MTESAIIKGCQRKDRRAQKALWEKYSPKMFGICKRYISNYADAEEVLVAALYIVLTKIESYQGKGSFEGWMRRIVINECLMFIRKRHDFRDSRELTETDLSTEVTVEAELGYRDLVALLEALPTGYRTVFNLYVIEGYKHREISDMLGISIHTSKSQLISAKKKMREKILKQRYNEVG